jgi:hypothetical protein
VQVVFLQLLQAVSELHSAALSGCLTLDTIFVSESDSDAVRLLVCGVGVSVAPDDHSAPEVSRGARLEDPWMSVCPDATVCGEAEMVRTGCPRTATDVLLCRARWC